MNLQGNGWKRKKKNAATQFLTPEAQINEQFTPVLSDNSDPNETIQ